ncbi:phosphatase PAP2 family protein [Paenibacillus radicibacter]|uniref:phosphatase PAP2 family protein n=1 Tax=Paenibacillus radicibacter TaxID=2972488 RepID=UPI002158B4B8|nr:phosphatase PAP2 family protein [Paenibacillus radicibacter]
MLFIPFLNIFYNLLNQHNGKVYTLITGLDQATPFIPAFIIPYVMWYPFIAIVLVLLFFKDVKVYFNTLFALCVGLIVCYVFYYFFQTTVPRPILVHSDWLTQMLKIIYANDMPYNCFPSIHVLTSYLMVKGARVLKVVARNIVRIIGILIILSTIFVKQHVIADIGMAIIVAECTYWLAGKVLPVLIRSYGKRSVFVTSD